MWKKVKAHNKESLYGLTHYNRNGQKSFTPRSKAKRRGRRFTTANLCHQLKVSSSLRLYCVLIEAVKSESLPCTNQTEISQPCQIKHWHKVDPVDLIGLSYLRRCRDSIVLRGLFKMLSNFYLRPG